MRHKYAQYLDDYKVFPRIVTIFVLYLWWKINIWFTQDWSINPLDLKEWILVQYASMNLPFIGFTKLFIEAWKTNHD